MKIGNREFQKIFNANDNIQEIAKLTGLLEDTVKTKATKLRAKGFKIKRLPRGNHPNNKRRDPIIKIGGTCAD